MSDLLNGLDGTPHSPAALAQAVAALGGAHAVVSSVAVVEGTENLFPTSHSAVLSLGTASGGAPQPLFLKKVTAAAMAHKPWADRRRTLAYIRTELRFYGEFGAMLRERGVPLPRAALLDGQLAALGETEVASPPGAELAVGGEVINCPYPLNVIKDTYDHSWY
jgi:hypothetical protein